MTGQARRGLGSALAGLATVVALSLFFLFTETRTVPEYVVWLSTGTPATAALAAATNRSSTTSPSNSDPPGTEEPLTNANASLTKPHSPNDDPSDNATVPGDAAATAALQPPRQVLCISGSLYGRNSNQLIETAAALKMASDNTDNVTTIIGLSPEFSVFYENLLDPRDDILLHYTGPCVSTHEPFHLFYAFAHHTLHRELSSLIPKAIYRAEAEAVLAALPPPVTTVHRRHLEGECIPLAEKLDYVHCPNVRVREELRVPDFVDIGNMEYSMVANETSGTTVVLISDSQVPELDATFSIVSDHSFPVQYWMMARSAVHYGNPLSTVDFMVFYWRRDDADTRPRACYKNTPEERMRF